MLDRGLFFSHPEFEAPQLSPDGRFVSFLSSSGDVTSISILQPGQAAVDARPVTTATRGRIRNYVWSHDGRYLAWVEDRVGDGQYHVYAIDPTVTARGAPADRQARDVTPYGNVEARIYTLAQSEPARLFVGLNDRDRNVHDLYRIDLQTGDRELVFENHAGIREWVADREGVVRIGVRSDALGGTEMLQVDRETPAVVYRCTFAEMCSPIRYHEDGRRFYLFSNRGSGIDLTRLILFDPETRSSRVVDADPERRTDIHMALFSDATHELLATAYMDDRMRLYPKNRNFARDLARFRREAPHGVLSFESRSRDGKWSIIRSTSDVDAGSTYLFDRDIGSSQLLFRDRPNLGPGQLSVMQSIRYRARDGLEITAFLTVPNGIEPRGLPTIVLPHDGPWARTVWGFSLFGQFLANRGYAVLQPNYRGSRGFGKRFQDRGDRAWGTGAMQHDLTDGVRHLIDRGITDSTRVGIFGRSYGGYAALAGLAFTPSVYRAGISLAGYPNLVTLIQSIPHEEIRVRSVFERRVGDPAHPADRARLIDQSPLSSADAVRAPLLVIHDARDPRVRRLDSEQLVVRLRDRNRPVEYIAVPDRSSRVENGETDIALAAVVERFFGKHLGGRVQRELPENIAARIAALTVEVSGLEAIVGLSGMVSTPLPDADGEALNPETLYYQTSMDVMGQEVVLAVRRTLVSAAREGRDLWRLVDSTQMLVGAVVDTADLDRRTLMPVRRHILSGGVELIFEHTSDSVTGTIRLPGQVTSIGLELEASAFADGPALETVIAALPLAAGYATPLRVFDVQLQRVRPMMVAVTGVETTRSLAGTFETYVVSVTPTDDDGAGAATLRVMRDRPHFVVFGTTRLPQAMGGGTAHMELTAIGGRIRAR